MPALPSPSCVTLGGHPTSLGSYLISSAEKVLKPSLRLRQARLECRPCLSFQPESQDGGGGLSLSGSACRRDAGSRAAHACFVRCPERSSRT